MNCQNVTKNISPQIISIVNVGADQNMNSNDEIRSTKQANETSSCKSGSQLSVVESTISVPTANQNGLRAIVLDCAAISYIDIMGVNMLNAIRNDLQKLQITFSLACVPSNVSTKLEAAGSITLVDDEKTTTMFTVYPTIQDAIAMETQYVK